jgi:hypothetical protein
LSISTQCVCLPVASLLYSYGITHANFSHQIAAHIVYICQALCTLYICGRTWYWSLGDFRCGSSLCHATRVSLCHGVWLCTVRSFLGPPPAVQGVGVGNQVMSAVVVKTLCHATQRHVANMPQCGCTYVAVCIGQALCPSYSQLLPWAATGSECVT